MDILANMSEQDAAVYYSPADYATTPRRIGAVTIDALLLILGLLVIGTIAQLIYVPRDVLRMPPSAEKQRLVAQHMKPIQRPASLGWLALCTAYHIGLRRLIGSTVGHMAMGQRLVDAQGLTPSWRVLAKRFGLAAPSVLFFGISYILCSRNPRRQAFHDRWAGTWVVKKRARIAGPAKLAYQTRLVGTILLTCIDVEPADVPELPEQQPTPSIAHEA